MHIEEISDEVAERLKLAQSRPDDSEQPAKSESQSQSQPQPPSRSPSTTEPAVQQSRNDEPASAPTPAVAGAFPELSPGRAMTGKQTVDEVVADLKKSPFFMTELEENDETEALKALAYEGTPLENAAGFKEQGNECFKLRRWADAKEFYTKGILLLAAEERKRASAAATAGSKSEGENGTAPEKGEGETTSDSEDEIKEQRKVLESLYGNRAACHLELKNYRSTWLDGSAALRLNDKNLKAYYRSAKAFLAVDRIEEADDACARGLALDEDNAALRAVARDIVKRSEEVGAKARRESERLAREKRRGLLVKAALRAREIRTRATEQPPEMEDAKLCLVPDPDDPQSTLSFPTVLLYPTDLRSDFVKSFSEMDSLADHLSYVFPLPWDRDGAYTLAGVECYAETAKGGLVKVGKKAPLLKLLAGGNVEVVDEVVRIFVVPQARAPDWVQDFKVKKAAEKGGG